MKRGMRKVAHKKAFKAVAKVVSSVASFAAPFIPGANVLSAIGLGAEIFSGLQQRKYASRAADAAQQQFARAKHLRSAVFKAEHSNSWRPRGSGSARSCFLALEGNCLF
jgi:uncharacterized protein HemX